MLQKIDWYCLKESYLARCALFSPLDLFFSFTKQKLSMIFKLKNKYLEMLLNVFTRNDKKFVSVEQTKSIPDAKFILINYE